MNTSVLHTFWTRHRTTILLLIVAALMAVLALSKLENDFKRLIWVQEWHAAIDLKRFHICVHHWFSGSPVYGVLKSDEYPPASYAILWPLLGWLELTSARWFWAVTSVAALLWFHILDCTRKRCGQTFRVCLRGIVAFVDERYAKGDRKRPTHSTYTTYNDSRAYTASPGTTFVA